MATLKKDVLLNQATKHFVQGVCKMRTAEFDWDGILHRFFTVCCVIKGQEDADETEEKPLLERLKDMESGFDEIDVF